MENWKIVVRHRCFDWTGKSWKCYYDETKTVSKQEYERFNSEKWQGDRRRYGYTPLGYMTVYLSNTDRFIGKKSIREFSFRRV